MTKSAPVVVLAGMIASDPCQGGATWAVLQYLLGLRRLGCEVIFVEPIKAAALEPANAPLPRSRNAAYFQQVVTQFGLDDKATLLLEGTRSTVGLSYEQLRAALRRADVLLNISGMLEDDELLAAIPVRTFLDLDPAFVQLWHAAEGIDMGFADHTHFVTIGLAIGGPECEVPTCGLDWITTPQPIVLERWPLAGRIEYDALTTVANFRGYGSIEHGGTFFGQKAHSLRDIVDLPRHVSEKILLALSIHPEEKRDLDSLRVHGWHLIDPAKVADGPASYQRFIQGSKAELGLAKSGYIASRCGWFSDRSLCYLASGRPVVAQNTAFDDFFPTGKGLFSFHTVEEAAECVRSINLDYDLHRSSARAIAEAHFDSDLVLPRLLHNLGISW